MMQTLGDIDLVTVDDVLEVAGGDGPWLSVSMPTARQGVDTLQGPLRLRNLLDRAEAELRDGGVATETIDALVSPVRALQADAAFWQHQGDGLVVWSSASTFRALRLPLSVDEVVTVGGRPRIRPVLPVLEHAGTFFVLAVSEQNVRLFEATAHSIGELDRGPIPSSMAEALAHEDPEPQLQVRAIGGGAVGFHGHGAGGEVDKAALERYFRAIGRGLHERLRDEKLPLVLASVGYYGPIFAAATGRAPLGVVEGSPDRLSAAELQTAAWPLVEPLLAAARSEAIDRYRSAAGTGLTSSVLEDIVTLASQGRVDALLVERAAAAQWGTWDATGGEVVCSDERRAFDDDLVDVAALETLRTRGTIHLVDEPLGEAAVVASLRY